MCRMPMGAPVLILLHGAKYCDEPDVVQCDPIEYGGFRLFLQLFKIVYYNLFYYLKIYTLAGTRY